VSTHEERGRMILELFGPKECIKGRQYYIDYIEQFAAQCKQSSLSGMLTSFAQSNDIEHVSNLWLRLLCIHIWTFSNFGFENFKQTIAKNYGISSKMEWNQLESQFAQDLFEITAGIDIKLDFHNLLKKHDLFSLEESYLYNTVTAVFHEYIKATGADKWLETVDEPILGNAPSIVIDGKNVSQDLLNSALDTAKISEGCDLREVRRVMEFGAGSGRLAFNLLSNCSNMKYVIVDIPPALFISQTYLTQLWPDKKHFVFRDFESFSEISDEFRNSDVAFLMPSQALLLPDKCIDLAIAINCFQEIPKDLIDSYFDMIDRLANKFYLKAYATPPNPSADSFYCFHEYPIKKNWEKVFSRSSDFPKLYNECFYNIG
jgi:putative sugar O-methyltransferase